MVNEFLPILFGDIGVGDGRGSRGSWIRSLKGSFLKMSTIICNIQQHNSRTGNQFSKGLCSTSMFTLGEVPKKIEHSGHPKT